MNVSERQFIEDIAKSAKEFRVKKIKELGSKIRGGRNLTDIEYNILVKWKEVYGSKK